MKYYCLQLSDYDCGFACLKMLLSFKLKDKEYLHLKQDIYKGEYSFLDLTLIAQKNHIILEGYNILNYKDIFSLPCIGIIKKEKYNHYILITKISKKYVTYFDPKIGEIVIDKNNFNLLNTGNYLFFKGTDNSFKKRKRKTNFFPLKTYQYIFFIITILQLISIFIVSFNIECSNTILISMIMLFVIMLIVQNIVRIRYLKSFDKKIINPLLDRKFKSPKIVFNNVFELKKDYFNYFHKVFLNSIVIGFISFILILNDLKNVCTITLILLIALLKNKLLCRYTSYLKYQIIFNENKNNNHGYKNANDLAYRYLTIHQLFNVITFIILIIFSFILCSINNNFYQFILYVLMLKLLLDKVELLINSNDEYLQLLKKINLYFAYI